MGKTTLSRIESCKVEGCNSPGVCKDGKCISCSPLRGVERWSGDYKVAYEDQPNPVNRKIKGRAVGVEIECYPYARRCDVLPHIKYWKTDCSLRSDGREMIICEAEKNAGKVVGEVLRALDQTGGKVDRTCGFHVHTSWKHSSHAHYNRTVTREDWEDSFRRGERLKSKLGRNVFGYFQDRSTRWVTSDSWITFKNQTVENRLHPATLNPDSMIAWIDVCLKIQDAIDGFDTKAYEKWMDHQDLKAAFHKNSYAYKYLKTREDNEGRLPNNFSLAQ